MVLGFPLVPVVVLYLLFNSQNFFELEGWVRGLVAGGPIAAYVFIVVLGWRVFGDSALGFGADDDVVSLVGEWAYTSTSSDSDTVFTGTCTFERTATGVSAAGAVTQDGTPVGSWTSEVVEKASNAIVIVYNMTSARDGRQVTHQGVSRLVLSGDHQTMQGTWAVLGEAGMAGTLAYQRKA
jgi:hypothetical protein